MPRKKVKIILSSSIILKQYGDAYKDIKNDNLEIVAQIDCLLANDTLESMSKTFALSIMEHSTVFNSHKPSGLLAVGDRFDMLSPVLAARMMNIPIFHIQGGEHSGSIDDYVRQIISICAFRHYVATEKSKLEVEKLTNSSNVFNTGCPAVEEITSIPISRGLNVTKLHKKFKHKIPINKGEKYILLVVHPNTTSKDDINMNIILESIMDIGIKCILFYPNADSFHNEIIDAINNVKSRSGKKILIFIKHAPLEDFVNFMANASCMIGNSSAGIREAASFGTPVINIGSRQNNRERNINIIDIICEKKAIIKAVEKSLEIGRYPINNIYYKPNAAKNIVDDLLKFI